MGNYSLNTICSVADLETFFFFLGGGTLIERIEVHTLAKFHIIQAAILPLLHNFQPPPPPKKNSIDFKKRKKGAKMREVYLATLFSPTSPGSTPDV